MLQKIAFYEGKWALMLIFTGAKTAAKTILQLAGKASKILFIMQASGGLQVIVEKVNQHSQRPRKQFKTVALILIRDLWEYC